MPRLKVPAPDTESRKALEQRAREATKPQQPEEKGRWPFSAHDKQPPGGAESRPESERASRSGDAAD